MFRIAFDPHKVIKNGLYFPPEIQRRQAPDRHQFLSNAEPAMPTRSVATEKQREFFNKLRGLDLVFSAKAESDIWSVNLHGRFELFEVDWTGMPLGNQGPRETMISRIMSADEVQSRRREPPVHVHVDWTRIRWATLVVADLPLIEKDRSIILSELQPRAPTKAIPVLRFYTTGSDIDTLLPLDQSIAI